MIREAIDRLIELTDAARKPQPIDLGDGRAAAFVVNGQVIERPTKPGPRKHKPGTLHDLIQLANRFGGEGGSPVVWYDHERVVLVIDDAGHRLETATLDLGLSDQFQTLRELHRTKAWLEQKPFVRLLRVELAGTLEPVHLLNAVRVVKFDNGVISRGEVQRNRESLGREIVSKVEPSAELPEQVTLQVPVFKTAGLRAVYPVRCAVDVDPPTGKFQLLPLPDEIEGTIARAVADVGLLLADGLEGVAAYQGKP